MGGGRGRYKGIGNRTVGGSWVPEGIFGLNFAMTHPPTCTCSYHGERLGSSYMYMYMYMYM